jgi:hypothetical protein
MSERMARCNYFGKPYPHPNGYHGCECRNCRDVNKGVCVCERPSSDGAKLAFFQARPEREYDSFYCGCHSWE